MKKARTPGVWVGPIIGPGDQHFKLKEPEKPDWQYECGHTARMGYAKEFKVWDVKELTGLPPDKVEAEFHSLKRMDELPHECLFQPFLDGWRGVTPRVYPKLKHRTTACYTAGCRCLPCRQAAGVLAW